MMPATLLDIACVRLESRATHREEAIREAGALLVAAGCVAPEYVDGMLAREALACTYLGSGIALPHGRFEDRTCVRRAGISFVRIPAGVEWDSGQAAHIVIGLAAADNDEHLVLISNLAALLDEPLRVRELIETRDPALVVERLTVSVAPD